MPLRPLHLTALLLLLGLWVLPRIAFAQQQRLAVLELMGEELSPAVRAALTDQLRQGALEALRDADVMVMTRENMAAMARSMGLDLSCAEVGAECEVDIARNIGADLVVSGGVVTIETTLVATIKLHETEGGSLLASETSSAPGGMALLEQLAATAAQLVRQPSGRRLWRDGSVMSPLPQPPPPGFALGGSRRLQGNLLGLNFFQKSAW